MSNIENLLYSAYQHGKRDAMYKKVSEIRSENKEIERRVREAYNRLGLGTALYGYSKIK